MTQIVTKCLLSEVKMLSRGKIIGIALDFYVLLGPTSGFISTRLYRAFGGKKPILNALLTIFLCPG